ncbi:hypothetical protein PTKIN_Ptkin15bG0103100 [Pterospermum kingtungense]
MAYSKQTSYCEEMVSRCLWKSPSTLRNVLIIRFLVTMTRLVQLQTWLNLLTRRRSRFLRYLLKLIRGRESDKGKDQIATKEQQVPQGQPNSKKSRKKKAIKQKDIVHRLKTIKPSLICLLETRVKEHNMNLILDKWFSGWHCFHNYAHAYNGSIWILYKAALKVNLVFSNDQSITVFIDSILGGFYFSGIYGFNTGEERKGPWDHLISLKHHMVSVPWLLSGDFNIITSIVESSSAPSASYLVDIDNFVVAAHTFLIFDHQFFGPFLTWSNKHDVNFLARKLDCVMINSSWTEAFPHS